MSQSVKIVGNVKKTWKAVVCVKWYNTTQKLRQFN